MSGHIINAHENHENGRPNSPEYIIEPTIEDRKKEKMNRRLASERAKVAKGAEVHGVSTDKERKSANKTRAFPKKAKVNRPTRNQTTEVATTSASTRLHYDLPPQTQDVYDGSDSFATHGSLYSFGNDEPISEPKLSRLQSFPSFSVAPEVNCDYSNTGIASQYDYGRNREDEIHIESRINSSDTSLSQMPKSNYGSNEQSNGSNSDSDPDSHFVPKYSVAPEAAYYKFGLFNQVVSSSTNISKTDCGPIDLSQDPDIDTTSIELKDSNNYDNNLDGQVRPQVPRPGYSLSSVWDGNSFNDHCDSDNTIVGHLPVSVPVQRETIATLGSPFAFSLGVNDDNDDSYNNLNGQPPSTGAATDLSSLTWDTEASSMESEFSSHLFQMGEFQFHVGNRVTELESPNA